MQELTPEGRRALDAIAQRHGVSADAALTLLRAVAAGGGRMAQFSHPDLGGMGQWSAGGMVMVGDMFNHGLKQRVDALCSELAALLRVPRVFTAGSRAEGSGTGAQWWPGDLGTPAASGAQNDMRYATFPASRRLAVQQGGQVRVYDTGDHHIGGVSQQQSGSQSLVFTSQHGPVRLSDLPVVDGAEPPAAAPPAPVPRPAADDPLAHIERLAELHQRGILSDEEFATKKAELLRRV
jgi:hypothetical protein